VQRSFILIQRTHSAIGYKQHGLYKRKKLGFI